MTREQAISLLTQVKELILGSESWLDSTHQPIEEAFGMAIEAIKLTQTNTPNTLNALDCISRQEAIDELMKRDKALRNINWYDKPFAEGECKGIDDALEIINALPSAQSELIERTAYIRGFEQGRTQGMIDSQGGKK